MAAPFSASLVLGGLLDHGTERGERHLRVRSFGSQPELLSLCYTALQYAEQALRVELDGARTLQVLHPHPAVELRRGLHQFGGSSHVETAGLADGERHISHAHR